MTELDTQQTKTRSRRTVFTCISLLLLLAGFAYYLWLGSADRILSLVTAAALLFLYSLCVIRLIPQWQRAWSGEPMPLPETVGGKRSLRPKRMHPFFRIAMFALLTRIVIFAAVYFLYNSGKSYQGGIYDLLYLWTPERTQSADYLTLAAAWYSASGELLSLLPFYPAAVRVLSSLFGETLVSGLVLSNLCFVFSAWLVYELTLIDTDRDTAMQASLWFCLLPGSILLMLPTADSLFLLLCLCCILLTRRHRYTAAAVFGMLAAFTRLSGILLLLPVGMELVSDHLPARHANNRDRADMRSITARSISLLLIPLGTALYCYVNYLVTGDPFFFIKSGDFRLGFFYDAAAQHAAALQSAISSNAFTAILSHSVQLLHLVVPLLVLLAVIPRIRASYSAFFLLYFALAVGAMPTAIPRLVMTAFPLYPMLAALVRRRVPRTIITLLLIALLCAAVFACATQWPIF